MTSSSLSGSRVVLHALRNIISIQKYSNWDSLRPANSSIELSWFEYSSFFALHIRSWFFRCSMTRRPLFSRCTKFVFDILIWITIHIARLVCLSSPVALVSSAAILKSNFRFVLHLKCRSRRQRLFFIYYRITKWKFGSGKKNSDICQLGNCSVPASTLNTSYIEQSKRSEVFRISVKWNKMTRRNQYRTHLSFYWRRQSFEAN